MTPSGRSGCAGEPLSVGEFAAKLGALAAPQHYAVAVSGGRDSMALMRLAAAHAATGAAQVLALIVDHGLREASAAETAQAAQWCESAGLPAHILRWDGLKPSTGIQQASRNARYRLLIEAAQVKGAGAILTAHTQDDQAETVFMRLSRGSGTGGLSAMAAGTVVAAGAGDPILLMRPLLDAPRSRIEATVAAFGQAYLDDPSNEDPAFERVRVRALLAALSEQSLLTTHALALTAARSAASAARLDAAAARAFDAAAGCFHQFGYASLYSFDAASPALLARIIRAVGGAAHQPAESEAASFKAALAEKGSGTLGGAAGRRHGQAWYVFREPSGVFGRAGVPALGFVSAAPGERLLWDRRFLVQNLAENSVKIGPLGQDLEAARSAAALCHAPLDAVLAVPATEENGQLRPAALSATLRVTSMAQSEFRRPVLRFH